MIKRYLVQKRSHFFMFLFLGVFLCLGCGQHGLTNTALVIKSCDINDAEKVFREDLAHMNLSGREFMKSYGYFSANYFEAIYAYAKAHHAIILSKKAVEAGVDDISIEIGDTIAEKAKKNKGYLVVNVTNKNGEKKSYLTY